MGANSILLNLIVFANYNVKCHRVDRAVSSQMSTYLVKVTNKTYPASLKCSISIHIYWNENNGVKYLIKGDNLQLHVDVHLRTCNINIIAVYCLASFIRYTDTKISRSGVLLSWRLRTCRQCRKCINLGRWAWDSNLNNFKKNYQDNQFL